MRPHRAPQTHHAPGEQAQTANTAIAASRASIRARHLRHILSPHPKIHPIRRAAHGCAGQMCWRQNIRKQAIAKISPTSGTITVSAATDLYALSCVSPQIARIVVTT